jgi:hypothetical protein
MSTAVTGAAGAYYVAAELSVRGWIASLTWGGAPRTDVLAQRVEPPLTATIQVKTRLRGDFQVGVAGEHPAPTGSNEWYVLVSLGSPGERPDFYVVPRNHMSAFIYVGFRAWVAEAPSRRNAKGTARTFGRDAFAEYAESWELLDRAASKAPWRLPEWVWDSAGDVGLPPGHPGLGRRAKAQRSP